MGVIWQVRRKDFINVIRGFNAMKEFNGYKFNDRETRQRMKYLVVYDGDLDVNGAYAFRSLKALKDYLKGGYLAHNVYAVFEITDVTDKYL